MTPEPVLPTPSRWTRVTTHWSMVPIAVFFCTHLSYLLFSWLGMQFMPQIHQADRDLFFVTNYALDGLCRWDCGWYKLIALTGYDPADLHTANIWPGYPLVTRAVMFVLQTDVHYALLIVSNLAALASLITCYRVFLLVTEGNVEASRWSLLLFAAFPFHFFQAAGYPESLMVFLSALAILFALQKRHILAGLALGLGTSTRHLTILLGTGLLAAQIEQRGLKPRNFFKPLPLLGLIIPFLFPLAFALFQKERFGDPLAFWHSRDLWGGTAWLSTRQVLMAGVPDLRHRIYLFVFAILLIANVACLVKKQWRVLGIAVAPLLIVLGASGVEALGRYAASAWPAFLPMGVWLSKRTALQAPLIGALYLVQGCFFWLFSHQFPIL